MCEEARGNKGANTKQTELRWGPWKAPATQEGVFIDDASAGTDLPDEMGGAEEGWGGAGKGEARHTKGLRATTHTYTLCT